MATNYPSSLDSFTNPTATDTLDSATVPHAGQHDNINDAVLAIETELGTNPKGAKASVKARLDAVDTTISTQAMPTGGTAGQVLSKVNSTNYNTQWTAITGSGSVVLGTTPSITTPIITLTYTAKTASYTFASGDEGNIFSMNNAATQQFNIPTDATFNFAIGTQFNVFWLTGAGQPTIGATTPGTTTVISTAATSATPKLRVANSMATAIKIAANSWIVIGDVS